MPIVDSHNWSSYIISVPDLVPESVFMERAYVRPNSYGWRLAANLYRDIFIKSLDLKRDFDRYYKAEYSNFADYLRKRHLLRREEVVDIATVYDKSAAIFRYSHPFSFLESNPGEELLKRMLLDNEVSQ